MLRSSLSLVVGNPSTNCPDALITTLSGLPLGWTAGGKGVCNNLNVTVIPDNAPNQTSWELSTVSPRVVLLSGVVPCR